MRQVKVLPTAQSVTNDLCRDKIVVVIDVLRATSVITTALHNKARAVFPFADISSARSFFKLFENHTALLCGERQGHIIEGFHLGNSPLTFTPDVVKNKYILLSTTNGSLAITKSTQAKKLFAASFLNISAIAKTLSTFNEELLIVCSGTNGLFSLDDGLCAGKLLEHLEKYQPLIKDDLGILLQNYAQQSGGLREKLSGCYHLNYLKSIGYEEDIDFCLTIDLVETVPILRTEGNQQWLESFS